MTESSLYFSSTYCASDSVLGTEALTVKKMKMVSVFGEKQWKERQVNWGLPPGDKGL